MKLVSSKRARKIAAFLMKLVSSSPLGKGERAHNLMEKKGMESLKEDPVLWEWVCLKVGKKPETLTMFDLHARYNVEMNNNVILWSRDVRPRFFEDMDEEEREKYENAGDIHQEFMFLRYCDQAKKALAWKLRTLEKKELVEWSAKQEEYDKKYLEDLTKECEEREREQKEKERQKKKERRKEKKMRVEEKQ